MKPRRTEAQNEARQFRLRSWFVLGALGLCAGAIVLRAVDLQVAKHGFLAEQGAERFMRVHALGDPVWRGLPNVPPAAQPRLEVIGKARHAQTEEVARNPRSRSAVLRVARKVRA